MADRVLSNPVTARADLTTKKELRIAGGVIESGVLDLGSLTTGDFVTPNDLAGIGIVTFRTGNDITFRSWGSADQVFDGATNAHRRLLLVMQAGAGSCSLGSGFSNGVVLRVGQIAEIWCDPYATAPGWRVVSRDITDEVQALLAGYATEAYVDAAVAAVAARQIGVNFTNSGFALFGTIRSAVQYIPDAVTITQWTLTGDGILAGSGTIDVEISSDGGENWGSITGGNPASVSNDWSATDSALTGWTTAIPAARWLRYIGSGFSQWLTASLTLGVTP